MRCPDCSKFVSMENGEPEVQDLSANYSDGSVDVNLSVLATRTCADCGTELKEIQHDEEWTFNLEDMEGWKDLPADKQAQVKAALDASELDVEVEEESSSTDESGGGRYAKNIVTTTVEVKASIDLGLLGTEAVTELVAHHDFQMEASAGEYEECC